MRERETDGQTDRQTERDRQTDRQRELGLSDATMIVLIYLIFFEKMMRKVMLRSCLV